MAQRAFPAAFAILGALPLLLFAGPARGQGLPGFLTDLKSQIVFSGYLQVDGVAFRQSSQDEVNGATGAPLNEDRFVLRRAHLRADFSRAFVSGALEMDMNTVKGLQIRPIDAEVSARWDGPEGAPPYLMLTMGLFKIPFGGEIGIHDTALLFLDRSNVTRALFPGLFDLGARLSGGFRFLRYSIAAMNGDPIGERAFPAVDPNKSKDLVVRLGVDVRPASFLRVTAGGSGVAGTGFHPGTPSTKDTLVWRDANEDGIVQISELQAIAGSAATPSQNFDRFALGGDLAMIFSIPRAGNLTVSGEVVWAKNMDRGLFPADPVPLGRDLRELGYHVELTQEITRYGMLGVRYDRYDPDADRSQQLGASQVPVDSSVSTLAIAGAVRYAFARLVVEYDHQTNALGRTASGLPTTLADDSLTFRGEAAF